MTFYLTTAIDYVNSRPHLGTAYEKVTADVIARYKRLTGLDTHFVMGNDEHSQNVFRRARELGEEPLAYCDRMEQEFRDVWRRLDISFDDFIRTTEPRHRTSVQTLVRRMRPPATSTRASTRAGTASRARRSSRRRTWSRGCAPCTGRSPTG
jgi:methionyl-tRNA synthetase